MAWIKTRTTDDGDTRFVACYRDPEGRQRPAGTYSTRRAAERAAHREEARVRDGAWHDHSRGQVTFAEYVETVWLPSKHGTLAPRSRDLESPFNVTGVSQVRAEGRATCREHSTVGPTAFDPPDGTRRLSWITRLDRGPTMRS